MDIGKPFGCLLAGLSLVCPSAFAQTYRGDAVPVIQRSDPPEFSRLRFLTFVFGREGPMDAPLRTPPVAGREYFVEADVFGIESVSSIRFTLVDGSGGNLETLTMWKASDSSADGEFYGFVKIPNQPFRAVAAGTTTAGAPFRSALSTLFQPAATGSPDPPEVPGGPSPNQALQLQGAIAAYRQELQARSSVAAAEHPDGLITIKRTLVSTIGYEPLSSSSGMPIGVRLHYTIRFPARQTIVAVPHVFPVYTQAAWRGTIAMKPLGGTINPAPQNQGVQSLKDVIVYSAPATYEAGTYAFTVDMVPDYVFQGALTGRFCIHEQKVSNRGLWDLIMASRADIPYSISISDTQTSANIPAFFPQRTLHDSFGADGALDCGPVPNIRF